MADYNLQALGPREFEHLTQALGLKILGPGLSPFGDGPDGGREAVFSGRTTYPGNGPSWDGKILLQCKFKQRLSPQVVFDGKWALKVLDEELIKFERKGSRRKVQFDYYVFATNVILTPVENVGTKDQIFRRLESFVRKTGIKGFDVWDYDKYCRMIDAHDGVRTRYAAFITPGDVLAQIAAKIGNGSTDFLEAATIYLQKELRADLYARFEQAGHTTEHKTPLAQLFVDLPVTPTPIAARKGEDSEEDTVAAVESLLEAGRRSLRATMSRSVEPTGVNDELSGRFVLVGGPGQGKSTLGQFLCQLYRAAILTDRVSVLPPEAVAALTAFIEQCTSCGLEIPSVKRFPIRIVLDHFANAISDEPTMSVLDYLAMRMRKLSNREVPTDTAREWLANYPWLLVLDGLDEVPAASNRKDVLDKILEFWAEAALVDADLMVVATTRPQGYSDEFSPKWYRHLYLTPLSEARALAYGERLVTARYGDDPDRRDKIMARLATAADEDTTSYLMRSPLQVTIMATLVDRVGQPPQERWRLFHQYYEVIYQRETERDIPASRILQQRKADVDAIHSRVGLLLQTESEKAGSTESKLSVDRFEKLVRARIMEEGHEGDEIEARTKEITDAALSRLVFLVGLESDRVGFEIRSLQEFMAAEALMAGSDKEVEARLREIAPISHWRNVFLFAAGKAFAERQHLRPTVLMLCHELNDPSDQPSGAAIAAGGQLAVELLMEGLAREQPKYNRQLAAIALGLLDVEDHASALRLALSYDRALEVLYRERATGILTRSDWLEDSSLWPVLCALADAQVKWARDMCEEIWHRYSEDKLRLLSTAAYLSDSHWLGEKVLAEAHRLPPFHVIQFVRHTWRQSDDLPAWMAPLESLETGMLAADFYNLLRFQYVSVQSREVTALRHIPLPAEDWTAFIAAADFHAEPTTANLAKAIRAFSGVPQHFVRNLFAWPLSACLRSSNNDRSILEQLATMAETGELGTINDWTKAEQRWAEQGVTLGDLEASSKPPHFGINIGTAGFPYPFAAVEIERPDAWRSLYKFAKSADEPANVTIATWAIRQLTELCSSGVESDIGVAELRELFAIASNAGFDCDILLGLPFRQDPDLWAQALGEIGSSGRKFLHAVRVPVYLNELEGFYDIRRPNAGILRVIAYAGTMGWKSKLPTKHLQEAMGYPELAEAALLLRLSQGGWDSADVVHLAKTCADLIGEGHITLWMVQRAVTKNIKNFEEVESFMINLWHEMRSRNPPTSIVHLLNQTHRLRRSRLVETAIWNELALPAIG